MTTGPGRVEPRLRLATAADREAISALMKASTRDLFPAFYDHRQTASSVEYIAHIDPVLIDDRTYYVAEVDGDLVACGGWSRRDKLFSGTSEQEERDLKREHIEQLKLLRNLLADSAALLRSLQKQYP